MPGVPSLWELRVVPNEALVRRFGIDNFAHYKKHTLRLGYLISASGSHPLDSILNRVGWQALCANSPRYLRPSGPMVNIGVFDIGDGIPRQMVRWFLNTSCLTWLSGLSYTLLSNTPNMQGVLTPVEIVEQERLKAILDSGFEIEDLMKAYERVTSKRARSKVFIRIHAE
ncbi:hypothetical protein EMPG_16759 [Blastomyces silverae]|uniref:Uncharacterized protein n=1 Tax=Blastomyces silverae TaxID=2060906 RepID=A0A0H1B8H4_9EURO|nr:hypothetical protein EMPG_16759 [Blastomyces silverae]